MSTHGSTIDMHVHTARGSADSSLTVEQMVEAAREAEIDGVLVAEHIKQWPACMAERVSRESGLAVCTAAEWVSEYGHVLVLGVNPDVRYVGPLNEMRAIVDDAGGFMILAHPFRYFPGSMNLLFARWPGAGRMSPSELARHPAFALVDEVEVLNNGCTDGENRLARVIACALGKRGVGGSDAHSRGEVGRFVTVFDGPVTGTDDLISHLRAGCFRAARRVPGGGLDFDEDGAPYS